MLYGSGMGQTSRIDAVKLAQLQKPEHFNHDMNGAVWHRMHFFHSLMVLSLHERRSIEYIIQPGGSIRDHEVIDILQYATAICNGIYRNTTLSNISYQFKHGIIFIFYERDCN
jgi:AICAR transformylase/IMP cyclohydrolase PurH